MIIKDRLDKTKKHKKICIIGFQIIYVYIYINTDIKIFIFMNYFILYELGG